MAISTFSFFLPLPFFAAAGGFSSFAGLAFAGDFFGVGFDFLGVGFGEAARRGDDFGGIVIGDAHAREALAAHDV